MSTANPPDRNAEASREPRHEPVRPSGDTSRSIRARQKDAFGGMKIGAAFFGWLTATGSAVLLSGLLGAVGSAVGIGRNADLTPGGGNAQTVGLIGGIVVLVVIFVAYLAGGYVAGRMARFNGAKQGLGVWLWAVIIAVVAAVLGLVAGARLGLPVGFDQLRLPIGADQLTMVGVVTALLLLVVSLAGAVLGGLAGMRFHRRVDRVTTETV